MFLQTEQAFVGIDDLLEVHVAVVEEGERSAGIVFPVEFPGGLEVQFAAGVDRSEYAPGEIAPHRNEVQVSIEIRLKPVQVHPYLLEVLVFKGLVNRHIVVPPAEVGGSARLDARPRGARDGSDIDPVLQQPTGRQRKQGQLYGSGEAAGIGYELCPGNLLALQLRQSIDIALALIPVVLGQVNHLQPLRSLVFSPIRRAFAVSAAEEDHVRAFQRGIRAELQIAVAVEARMHFPDLPAGAAGGLREADLHIRVIHQYSYEFARSVARGAYYSCFDHCALIFFPKAPSRGRPPHPCD